MATPFTRFLTMKRHEKSIRQQELAQRLGVGSSYVCAMEAGRRLPRSKAFLKKIATALELDPGETAALFLAARRSTSTVTIPAGTSPEVRELVYSLVERSEVLNERTLEIMRILLAPGEEEEPEKEISTM